MYGAQETGEYNTPFVATVICNTSSKQQLLFANLQSRPQIINANEEFEQIKESIKHPSPFLLFFDGRFVPAEVSELKAIGFNKIYNIITKSSIVIKIEKGEEEGSEEDCEERKEEGKEEESIKDVKFDESMFDIVPTFQQSLGSMLLFEYILAYYNLNFVSTEHGINHITSKYLFAALGEYMPISSVKQMICDKIDCCDRINELITIGKTIFSESERLVKLALADAEYLNEALYMNDLYISKIVFRDIISLLAPKGTICVFLNRPGQKKYNFERDVIVLDSKYHNPTLIEKRYDIDFQ